MQNLLPVTNFRDEMIMTASVIGITIVGSFFLLSQFVSSESKPGDSETMVLGSQTEANTEIDINNESVTQIAAPTATPLPSPVATPTPTPTPKPTPTPTPASVEISYGSSQSFENDNYLIDFNDPRLIVGSSRVFKMTVVISNKNVTDGIDNEVFGVLSLDGEVIGGEAPLTLSEKKKILPGEKLTFTASLTVPGDMMLDKVTYQPTPDTLLTTYNLDPTL